MQRPSVLGGACTPPATTPLRLNAYGSGRTKAMLIMGQDTKRRVPWKKESSLERVY